MTEFDSVIRVATDVLAGFSRAGIDHVLGGAMAFGYWAVPRGTMDVDVTVFVDPDHLEPVFDVLDGLGAGIDRPAAVDRARRRGMFDARVRGIRIDVFIPDIPLYDSARARRRVVRLQGLEVPVWAPEDILLFKLLYFRAKDKVDVETLVQVQGKNLDVDYIRTWLNELVGAEDERSVWFRLLL